MARNPKKVRRQVAAEPTGPGARATRWLAPHEIAEAERPQREVPPPPDAGFTFAGMPNPSRAPRVGGAAQLGRQTRSGKRVATTDSLRTAVDVRTPRGNR